MKSAHEGVNQISKDVTQTQQQRRESPTVTLTRHASKCKVHKLHQDTVLNKSDNNNNPAVAWDSILHTILHQYYILHFFSSVDNYSKTRYKKLFTHVESHPSAVSLLESGEQRYIKAINNSNNNKVPGEIKRSRDLRGGRWSWTFKLAQKRS